MKNLPFAPATGPLLGRRGFLAAMMASSISGSSGCSIKVAGPDGSVSAKRKVVVDGSSTVYPITAAVAELFCSTHPKVQVPVGNGGTSSGFKKLLVGEVDIAAASRPVTSEELEALKQRGIDVLELEIALDGLSVVVSKENDWCSVLTVKQLHELWKAGSELHSWNQLDPSWPASKIKLFGAGTNSGTFEYFTEVVNGKKGNSRSDYSQSEDDNQLVIGVSGDRYALGYFGYSYFDENRERLKAIRIAPGDNPDAAVEPNRSTIVNGTYTPLSRPLYLYVSKKSLMKSDVVDFLRLYLSEDGQRQVSMAHCIGMGKEQRLAQVARLDQALAGLSS